MVSKEELALVDRHLAAENEHRMDDTLATLHPACVFEDMAMPKVYRGRQGARDVSPICRSIADVLYASGTAHRSGGLFVNCQRE